MARTLRNGRKRWELFLKFDGRCAICGELLDGDFQIDHRTPYRVVGCTDLANLQPTHPECNRRKGGADYGNRYHD
jgi:5-methylcytosine-specific restriction endonuclease McrA